MAKILKAMMIVLASAAWAGAAQPKTCADPGIAGLYWQAASTGQETARNGLGTAMFTVIRCLATGGVALPKSQLRGPYTIAIEYLSYASQVSISFVSDEEIDAMARLLPKCKADKTKKVCSGGCYD